MKSFTFLQLLNVIDGRLFTTIMDIHSLFEHLTGGSVWSHELPTLYDQLKAKNPEWFKTLSETYQTVCKAKGWSDQTDWTIIRDYFAQHNPVTNIPFYSYGENTGTA